ATFIVEPGRVSDHLAIGMSQYSRQLLESCVPSLAVGEIQMQKAHLYEAILLLNRGVDDAARGLECRKRAFDLQLDSSSFDEELVLFEDHRARLNFYFCGPFQRSEQRDS